MANKGRKPKDKIPLTIFFDTKIGVENFISWYLNSGEQSSSYYSKGWGKDWLDVEVDDNACPKCEYPEEDIQTFFWENRKVRKEEFTCRNCDHKYMLENYYPVED